MFENCYLMLIYFNNKKNKKKLKPKNVEKQEEKIIEYKDIFKKINEKTKIKILNSE